MLERTLIYNDVDNQFIILHIFQQKWKENYGGDKTTENILLTLFSKYCQISEMLHICLIGL